MKISNFLILLFLMIGCTAPQGSGWRTIDTGPFTFSLPLEFQKTAMQGIDSYVSEYKAVGLSVLFDYGAYPGDALAPLGQEKGVAVTTEQIGGQEVEMVTFQINPYDEQKRNYRVIASFQNASLMMSATCETLDGCELAKEIFRSVRFKQR